VIKKKEERPALRTSTSHNCAVVARQARYLRLIDVRAISGPASGIIKKTAERLTYAVSVFCTWVARVKRDHGELQPWHYMYAHSIESRL